MQQRWKRAGDAMQIAKARIKCAAAYQSYAQKKQRVTLNETKLRQAKNKTHTL